MGGHSEGEGGWRANPTPSDLLVQMWVPCIASDIGTPYFELRRACQADTRFPANVSIRKGRRPHEGWLTVKALNRPTPGTQDFADYAAAVQDAAFSLLGYIRDAGIHVPEENVPETLVNNQPAPRGIASERRRTRSAQRRRPKRAPEPPPRSRSRRRRGR